MADKGGQPTSLSEAKRLGSPTYKPTTGRNKGKIIAAVSKEDMKKAGFKSFGAQSLRKYLNQQKKEKKSSVKEIAAEVKRTMGKKKLDSPKPKSKSKRKIPAPVKESPGADLSAPEITKSKRKKPEDILGTREKSRAARRARQEAKTKADTSMTPEQKLKGQIGISAAAAALLGSAAIPILMRVATKHGPAFARSLGDKIKNLTSRQQQNVAQAANNAATKTKAQQQTSQMLRAAQRTQSSRKPLKKDRVEPYLPKSKKPLTKGQSSTARLLDAAKQSQRKEIDPGYTGGALKKGGPIKKYNEGGKVVNRKGGGQVMSGNDLVSSLYD